MVFLSHVLSLRVAENERWYEQEPTRRLKLVANISKIVVLLGNMFPTFAKFKADDKALIFFVSLQRSICKMCHIPFEINHPANKIRFAKR